MGARNVAFYVSPHQDDWQFFRGEQAWVDLRVPDVRIVFIYTTAGDAGQEDGWWEAREKGALASIRSVIPPAPLKSVVRTVAGHPITVWECGNSASYCLRLPDGVGTRSLSNLRDGVVPGLNAVDRSTTYHGWDDFVGTIRELLAMECSLVSARHPWVNAPDYDRRRNPREHPDHEATGDALRAFLAGTYRRAWWVGHDAWRLPPNLDEAATLRKRKLFEAYSQTIVRETTANGRRIPPNETEWRWWGDRSYATLRQVDEPDE
jgi:hypothetical protein